MPHEYGTRGFPQRNERADHAKQTMMSKALKKKSSKYGNSMYDYGNDTKGGIHVTHWKDRQKPYGGSNQGGGSIGGGTAGGAG